jgi:hypothetical protein
LILAKITVPLMVRFLRLKWFCIAQLTRARVNKASALQYPVQGENPRFCNRLRADGNAAKRTDLDRIERRIRRIVELITDDDAPVRALKQELVTLEARQLTLQHELAATDAPAQLIHPNLAEVYRQRVVRLHHALRDPASRDEAFALIRSLIDGIRLVPENGELLWVELHGALAGILALAADSKKPAALRLPGWRRKSRWLWGDDARASNTCRRKFWRHAIG